MNPFEYQPNDVIYQKNKKKKSVQKFEPEELPDPESTFIDPLVELGLLNREIVEKTLNDETIRIDVGLYNEMNLKIKELETEN